MRKSSVPEMGKRQNPCSFMFISDLISLEFHDEKSYKKKGGPPRSTGYENAIRSIQNCSVNFQVRPSTTAAYFGRCRADMRQKVRVDASETSMIILTLDASD